ncbi:magnesium/cobalt transporter CorA [Chitinimonas koreensis]|uniref:magnesium/cobalt transporter CorA n=1 Tax=Chitinimonas koreensis TaxID=356302 RepID=UPI000416CD4D|nr:magnesium/cobalt transporter CorA [Chitinimonas koreensis]QNM96222.1 magnesium/cobalt transporter CorA [Chitinimonas koreensis]
MINLFTLVNGRLAQLDEAAFAALDAAPPVWIDLVDPDEADLDWVRNHFDLAVPDWRALGDIEESARFFEDDSGGLHLRANFLIERDGGYANVAAAFVLRDGRLYSVRGEESPVFRLLRLRARSRPGYVENALDVLLELFAVDVEHSADALEDGYRELEGISKMVLGEKLSDTQAGEVLQRIAREEDMNGRIRQNLMETRRAVSSLMRGRLLDKEQFNDARQIMRDIDSLDGHTAFLFDKINFLMDATVGFININQNKIIKIFSVASVALLPPTLIASVYGMNFGHMPELEWRWGYPFALGLMALSVAAPFWYFQRKGWLR